MMLSSMQTRASTGRWCPMQCAPFTSRTLRTPRHHATRLHASRRCCAAAAAQRPARRSRTALAPKACLHSDPSADSSGGRAPPPGQLKVLVVGANAAGLAAAVALSQQAGCAVEVHDSRPDPRDDQQNAHDENSNSSSTLVALGKRGLQALSNLDGLPLHSASSSSSNSVAGLWTPGSAATGALTPSGVSTTSTSSAQPSSASGGTSGGTDPLPGLTLLQGMVVVSGPRGQARREEYSRPASRSKQQQPGGASLTGGMTAGIVAVDEVTLTAHLLSAAAAFSHSPQASQSLQPQLVLPGAQAAADPASGLGGGSGAEGGTLRPKGMTAISQGPTTAPSAEAAQEAALPPVVPTPGTASPAGTGAGSEAETPGRVGYVAGDSLGGVEVHYSSHLTLFDAANKQATFMGPGGAATIVPYDLCIAADASGGGHLVTSALQELQDRKAAHRHPGSSAHHSSAAAAAAARVSELEYCAWQDMPHDAALAALLRQPGGANLVSSTIPSSSSTSPQQGWLLVWTGPGTVQAAHPRLSSAGAPGSTAIIPGAPSCTVMAWPSKGGTTWSGCVFTQPQVLEALRSQSDYEQLLGSLSAPSTELSAAKLPQLWVRGIAAQMPSSGRVGRVPAAATPPPKSLSAPDAGLVALTPAAVPSNSPQLLNPGVALGLAEASRLAAALSAQLAAAGGSAGAASGSSTAVTGSAESIRRAVQQGLQQFDAQHGPEARALHKLTAQLSWLRHPFSPAAAAAAASVPVGSLAWICAALGAPRTGLALQWRCLLAVLPLIASVQRVLLYKLGLGRPDAPAAAAAAGGRSTRPDASYRRAAAATGSSLDSGVHVSSNDPAQAQKEAAALSAVSAGAASKSAPAYSLVGLADSVEPCGASFSSFLHTTDMQPTGIWRLLQVAPLLVSVLWGALLWAGWQAVRWGMWAFRAWGWSQSGVA